MVCLSADQFAEKPPGEQWSGRDTIEARGTKWNFDVEMDSGISGPTRGPRRDEGMPTGAGPMEMPTVLPLAPPPEKHVFEMQVHSNSGGCGGQDEDGDLRPILHESCEKTKVIGKVFDTNIFEAPVPKLLNEDGKLIDTGQIIITQKLQLRKIDINATMVSWSQLVTSVDRYITNCELHLGDSCNLLGSRVPKCTRW